MKRGYALGIAIVLLLGFEASAQRSTRSVEALGAVPYTEGQSRRQETRRRALAAALRNAVLRVAQDIVAEDGRPQQKGEAALAQALGSNSVEYTARYTIVEDRGGRPALFSSGESGEVEYVVVARVEVDPERIRARLREAGVISKASASQGGHTLVVSALGVEDYAAYEALAGALRGMRGVAGVVPGRFSRSAVQFVVDTRERGTALMAALAGEPVPGLTVVPIRADSDEIRVRIAWRAPAPAADSSQGGHESPAARPGAPGRARRD